MRRQAWACLSLVACLLCSLPVFAELPRDIVLLLDNTASMKSFDQDYSVRRLALGFVEETDVPGKPATRLSLGLLAHDSELLLPLMAMNKVNRSVIAHTLKRLNYQERGGNLSELIGKAIDEFAQNGTVDSAKSVILLAANPNAIIGKLPTDAVSEHWVPDTAIDRLRRANVKLFCVGVGSGDSGYSLQRLAEGSGGAFFAVQEKAELPDVFAHIDVLSRSESVALGRRSVRPGIETAATQPRHAVNTEEWTPSLRAKSTDVTPAYALWMQQWRRHPLAIPGAVMLVTALIGYLVLRRHDSAASDDVMLEQRDDGCWLLVGRNAVATYVNDRLMRGELRLQLGDRIRVADLEFAFSAEALQRSAAVTEAMQADSTTMDSVPARAPRFSTLEPARYFGTDVKVDERSARRAKARLRTELAAMRAALAPERTDPTSAEVSALPLCETTGTPFAESTTDVAKTSLVERGSARTAIERLAATLAASGNLRH